MKIKLKRFLILLLSTVIILSMVGCTEENKEVGDTPVEGNEESSEKTTDDDSKNEENEITTDVVVIGSGGTGLAAAKSANENGADVIVLEKLGIIGGSTALSAGGMGAPGSRFLKEEGVEGTAEDWMEFWKESQETSNPDSKYPDYDRVRKYMDDAVDTVHWMVDNMNHEFDSFGTTEEKSGSHRTDDGGAAVIKSMEETLKNSGIEILKETKAVEILTNENGDAVGVKAENKDGTLTVNAKKVIIAAGGFAHNEELLERFVPSVAGYSDISIASTGATGDGIVMGEEIGAELYEDPWVIGIGIGGKISELYNLSFDPTKIYINEEGERYMDESRHYSIVTNKSTEQENIWTIVDSSEANSEVVAVLEDNLEGEEVVKADTIEGLAEPMGLTSDKLVNTVDTFNKGVETGEDEFEKPADKLVAVNEAPFYAYKLYPMTMGTMGGVKVDENYRVLKEDGSVIENLYAGGESANRHMYNQVYMSASAVQYALTSGRLAGEHAAQSIE